ncbi:MAG: CotH kinase family protein, partial [Bacteroidota bacterium]
MLITQVSGQRQKVLTSLIPLGALVGIILFGSFVIYPYYLVWLTKDGSEGKVIRCDMERAWRSHIISGGTFFDHARTRTKEVSRSGKYSSKLASGNVQYGVGHKMAAVPGQRYLASVWVKASVMKNNVYLVASSVEDAENFHVRSNKLTDQEKGGWRKLVLDFSLPDALDWEELQIFISTEGHAEAYFDDFEIKLLSKDDKVEEKEPQAFQAPRLEIKLSAKQYAKLDDKRKQAFRDGVLLSDEDSWAKGKLLVGGEELPIKTRLKGDWLDHLRGDKWSFRVKVKGAYAWDGLKTFSLHNPSARYFLWEWMIHKLFEREDVLTTTYDFAELTFNGKSLGIYAYEEHFEKQLVESRKRREGPIVRFSEDALWKYRARAIQAIGYFKKDFVHPSSYPKQAEIKAFKEGKTAGSENLSKQFEIAQTLMYQMQQGEAPASEIFDLKRLARFFAISDMMGAWHGLVWHNIRYYYNPVISKLEPIGYDNFNDKPRKPLILGKMPKLDHTPVYADPSRLLFLDEAFMEAYVEELLRLSSEEYLEEFVQEIRPGLKQRLLF